MEKDAALAETVILGLLQYWPTTNSAKCVLYLGELEELLELTQPQEFLNICGPLFRTISRCLMSPHFQVRSSSPQLSRCLLLLFCPVRDLSLICFQRCWFKRWFKSRFKLRCNC